MLDKEKLYYEIEDFFITYWEKTYGHSIYCFDNTMEDLDHFLDEDEMLQFVTYINTTFETNFSTEVHACITLDQLYKQILKKAFESYDGTTDIFHEEKNKHLKKWGLL